MMRKGRRGNPKFFLNLTGDHADGVSRKKQAHNLQSWLGADGGKAIGAAVNQEGVGLLHISMIAEIWKYSNLFFSGNPLLPSGIPCLCARFSRNPSFFRF